MKRIIILIIISSITSSYAKDYNKTEEIINNILKEESETSTVKKETVNPEKAAKEENQSSDNEKKTDEAMAAFYKILPLCRAMFLETNPIPVKAAMEMMGVCGGDLRLPLVPISDANREILRKTMADYGVKLK